MSLDPGRKLAHYEVLEPIGKGGMGEVYRAKDAKLGRDVAIKVLPDELAQDEERLRRFRDGARNVYGKPSDGSGAVTRLTESTLTQWPETVSPDGQVLFIDQWDADTNATMAIVQLDLSTSSQVPFVQTDAWERLPAISPDGRFVAHESTATGATQIYVRTHPEGGGPWQITNEGGMSPAGLLTAASCSTWPTVR